MRQETFFDQTGEIARAADIDALLAGNAPVAVGVSGGKDSQACALEVARYLDSIGHTGPRVLVHSDLGRVEWGESLPTCERLAAHLGWELITVRRAAGDLMDRWLKRWANNVARYVSLECVKLILPWSTPAMRFCTSELKTAVIAAELRRRWPTGPIVSVVGIRGEESTARAHKSVSEPHAKLARKGSIGVSWHPILWQKLPQVLDTIQGAGLALHPAYTVYGASRVSCAFCIMSSGADLAAAASAEENADIYREMVGLELDSTFAFQGARWLADVAPTLLSEVDRARIPVAKARAELRTAAEARIPSDLLYVKGWPTFIPSAEQAALVASVRREVSAALGLTIEYTEAGPVRDRYAQLFVPQGDVSPDKVARGAGDQKPVDDTSNWQGVERGTTATTTTGWLQDCDCPAAEPIPATVFDPFGGAGTTALVADRLQRDALSIELNQDYIDIAKRRIVKDGPLFAEVTA